MLGKSFKSTQRKVWRLSPPLTNNLVKAIFVILTPCLMNNIFKFPCNTSRFFSLQKTQKTVFFQKPNKTRVILKKPCGCFFKPALEITVSVQKPPKF